MALHSFCNRNFVSKIKSEKALRTLLTCRSADEEPTPIGWIDVNREVEHRPANFRSRNVAFERFFDAQRRRERFSTREQWTKKNVGSSQFADGGGKDDYIGRRCQIILLILVVTLVFVYLNSLGSWSKDLQLPKLDYKNLNLPPIRKNFYREHPSVANKTKVF